MTYGIITCSLFSQVKGAQSGKYYEDMDVFLSFLSEPVCL